jgi:hypothetical protein
MLLLLFLGVGSQTPIVTPVRAYAAISFSLISNASLTVI